MCKAEIVSLETSYFSLNIALLYAVYRYFVLHKISSDTTNKKTFV